MKPQHARTLALTLLVLALSVAPVAAEHPYVKYRQPLPNGDTLIGVSTPLPPPSVKAPIAVVTADEQRAPVLLANVPAFDWCYGCAATSAAMMAGYYDNNGYTNSYAGPANGGVCPMDNSVWGSGHSPLSATEMGYDGLAVRGHVDDYWVAVNSGDDDPYIGNWAEHSHADCTGDFMKTNQSAYGNIDGGTTLYYFESGAPYSGTGPSNNDGAYGIRLFFESRGYTVTSHFTRLILGWDGNTGGMTFAEYRQEIDAGRPVLIHVEGHSMLGYGYDTAGELIWLHDTWDYSDHTMAWGGWYPYGTQQLNHWGVTCLRLAPNNVIFADGFETGTTGAWSN